METPIRITGLVLLLSLSACQPHRVPFSEEETSEKPVTNLHCTQEQAARIHVGALAPSISLPLLSDATHLVSLPRDSVLLLFWASWCTDCHEAIPRIQTYLRRHPAIQLVTVSLDTDLSQARTYITNEAHLQGIHLGDGRAWKGDAPQAYAVQEIPKFILITPNGRIAGVNSLEESFDGLENTTDNTPFE